MGGSSERWRPLPRKEGGSAMIYAGLAVVVLLRACPLLLVVLLLLQSDESGNEGVLGRFDSLLLAGSPVMDGDEKEVNFLCLHARLREWLAWF